MSDVWFTPEGGTSVAMTMRSALAKVPREVDMNPLLRRMGLGEEVVVPTTDGNTATMVFRNAMKGPDPDQPPFDGPYTIDQAETQWPVKALAAPRPFHLYHAKGRLLIELKLRFSVPAASEKHAEEIFSEVSRGHEPPVGFKLNYDPESLQDFLLELKSMMETASLRALSDRITGCEVLEFEDYLDYQPELLYQEAP